MGKNKKLYNYLVNTLGLSKEMVLEHVNLRLDDLETKVENILKDKLSSNYIEILILNKITSLIKNGFENTHFWTDNLQFEKFVKECIKSEIKTQLNEQFNVEVKLVSKDSKIVHKVLK